MLKWQFLLLTIFLVVASGAEESEEEIEEENRIRRDSYLEAYEESHGSSGSAEPDSTPDIVYSSPEYESPSPSYFSKPDTSSYSSPISPSYSSPISPSYSSPVSPSYSSPVSPSYSSPVSPSYSSPDSPTYSPSVSSSYSAPAIKYGPPVSYVYGPPSTYGPPLKPYYGAPYSASGTDLLSGIDFHTILTIILKIVIFKMIVKFITVLCLLLFIPKFDTKKPNSDKDEMRSSLSDRNVSSIEDLNELTRFVVESVERNNILNSEKCSSDLYCKIGKAASHLDSYYTFYRLLDMFIEDSNTVQKNNKDAGKRNIVGDKKNTE